MQLCKQYHSTANSPPKVRGEHVQGYIPYWDPAERQWVSYRTVELYIAAVNVCNPASLSRALWLQCFVFSHGPNAKHTPCIGLFAEVIQSSHFVTTRTHKPCTAHEICMLCNQNRGLWVASSGSCGTQRSGPQIFHALCQLRQTVAEFPHPVMFVA